MIPQRAVLIATLSEKRRDDSHTQEKRLDLINTLNEVTEGKIFVEAGDAVETHL